MSQEGGVCQPFAPTGELGLSIVPSAGPHYLGMLANRIWPLLVPVFLPLVVRWAEAKEDMILKQGRPLSEEALRDAVTAGVKHPEKIRILAVEKIPLPENPMLRC